MKKFFSKPSLRSFAFFILAISVLLSISGEAQAYNKNISGVWHESDGTTWTVVQMGTSCGFSTSLYTQQTGRISFNYVGYISDNGGDDDFSFSGMMEPKTIRIRGKNCRLTGNMNLSGDVAGEYGGRVLHIGSCNVTINIACGDDRDTISGSCAGTWT